MFLYVAIAFIISVSIIPLIIVFCKKYRIYDTVNTRKVHTGNVPRLGAVGFVSSFLIVSLAFILINERSSLPRLLPFGIASLIIFIFGIIDDIKEMRGIYKLAVQSIAAIIVILFDYRFTNVFGFELGFLSYPLTYIWIIGMVNSFNLIDGIDALCGGLSFFILITIGLLSLNQVSIITTLSFTLAASILGFLVYNKPKAKIFMGDGGSQFLGFSIAVLPLYFTTYVNEPSKLAMIALLSAIPLFDTIAAMWRRTREHRSFFSADKAHLHHKLMNLGYHTPSILILLYSIQMFVCTIVLIADFISFKRAYLVLASGFLAVILFFTLIHYTNRAVLESKKPDFKNEIDEH